MPAILKLLKILVSFYLVLNRLLASILTGPTISFTAVQSDRPKNTPQASPVEMIWSRQEDTEERTLRDHTEMNTEWCSMSLLIVTVARRRKERGIEVETWKGIRIERGGGRDRHHPDIRRWKGAIEIAREREIGMDMEHEVGATIESWNAVTGMNVAKVT